MQPFLNPSSLGLVRRRGFLQGALAGSIASCGFASGKETAKSSSSKPRQVLFIWLGGGASQFETWDPKPGRPTGGPFRSIPTKLPGVHFGELMPKCASIADQLSVI